MVVECKSHRADTDRHTSEARIRLVEKEFADSRGGLDWKTKYVAFSVMAFRCHMCMVAGNAIE